MHSELSIIIPTFNNLPVLKRCLESWERFASDQPVEILVIEDGCKDETPAYLKTVEQTKWGKKFLRWFHEGDVHQLRCNNRGFAEARSPLSLVWDDDMFLDVPWLVPELLETFRAYQDIGLLSLIRGLNCFPSREPIEKWDDLHQPERLQSTMGPIPGLNWFRLAEVDIVVRPWVVRRECLDKVGNLDEAFCPVEWDEADLCYRIRAGGWKVATYGYERIGAFTHLGSTTLGKMDSEKHKKMVLPNGQLFHKRWDETITREHPRHRKTWWRRVPVESWPHTARQIIATARKKARLYSPTRLIDSLR
jgi:glycosyltransferase involved in cell wall biosynthesis